MARTKQTMRKQTSVDEEFRRAQQKALDDEWRAAWKKEIKIDGVWRIVTETNQMHPDDDPEVSYTTKFKHICDSCGERDYLEFQDTPEDDPEPDTVFCESCGADTALSNIDDTRDDPEEDSDESEDESTPIKVVDLTERPDASLPPTPKKPSKPSNPPKKKCYRKIDFDAVTLEYHSDKDMGIDDIEFRGSMHLAPPEDDDCKIIGENWGAAVKRKRDVTLCIESNATMKTLFETLKHYVIETDESQEIVDRVYAIVNKNA